MSNAPVTASSSTPNPAFLKGNWLVAGSLPLTGPGQPSPLTFGLAVTLDLVNGQLIGSVSEAYPCTTGTVGGAGGLATGTVAADGTFTLQPESLGTMLPTLEFQIHGTAPTAAGQSWSGTYTASNANTGCTPISGSFTAMPIPAVSGTFAGTGTLAPQGAGSTTTPITIAATLQQGGPASLDTGTSPIVNSVNILGGSIRVQGSSCFSTGTIAGTSGDVLGNFAGSVFTMDDGSKLFLTGRIADLQAATILVNTITVMGGKCDGWFGFSGVPLLRQ